MLNKTVYDALPYALLGAGLLSLISLDSRLRFLPALLLVSAGLLILAWRREALKTKKLNPVHRRAKAGNLRGGA